MLDAIKTLFDLSVVPDLGVKVHQEMNSGFIELVRSIGIKVRNTPVEFVAYRPTGLQEDHYLVIIHTKKGAAVVYHNDAIVGDSENLALLKIVSIVKQFLNMTVRDMQEKLRNHAVNVMVQTNAIRPTEQSITDIIAQSWNEELTGKA